jgi:HEAT repeat protein
MTADFSLEDTIAQLQHDPKPEVRRNAAWVLGRQRDPRIVAPLIAAADDADASVRVRVAEALGNLKDAQVIAPLLRLLQDDDAEARLQAAKSVGMVGSEQAVEPLIAALRDSDASVRAQVTEALGSLHDGRAADPLVHALDDEDANVRYFAAQSLAQIGGESVISALITGLTKYADSPIMLIDILTTLGKLGDKRAAEAVQALANHAEADVREMAVWTLQQLRY